MERKLRVWITIFGSFGSFVVWSMIARACVAPRVVGGEGSVA